MTAMAVVIFALLAVPVVLMFATAGCGLDPIEGSYDPPEQPPKKPEEPKSPQKPIVPEPGSPLTTSYRDMVRVAQGLVGYWRLGEASTAQPAVNSFTPGTLDGAYVNGAAINLGQDGVFAITADPDTAAYFSGLGYVNVPDHVWLNTASVTVEFWAQWRQNLLGWPVLVGRFEPHLIDNRITRGYRVRTSTEPRLDGSGTINIEGAIGGMTDPLAAEIIYDAQEFNAQKWHYIVLTYNDVKQQADLYVDGIFQDSSNGKRDAALSNTRPLRFATNSELIPTTTFAGALDEVAVYSRALTSMDVTHHIKAAKL